MNSTSKSASEQVALHFLVRIKSFTRYFSRMKFVDSHAHLSAPSVSPHVDELLERAKLKGAGAVVNICTDPATLEKGLQLAQRYPWIFNAAATTPHDVEKEGELFLPLVREQAQQGRLVALGETGLDYHYQHSPIDQQKEFLLRYFALAIEMKLPLIFHCRQAFDDLFAYADLHYQNRPAVLHCFTGTLEEAKGCLNRGWSISMSGIVTFPKSVSLREVAAYVPLNRLFVETDTPYLAPQSKRGQPNEPSYIVETMQVIADVKGISLEEVVEKTAQNAAQFFSFPKQFLRV